MRRPARRTTARVRSIFREQLPRRLRGQFRYSVRARCLCRHSVCAMERRPHQGRRREHPRGLAVPGFRCASAVSDDHRRDAKEGARRQLWVHGGAALLDRPPRTHDPGILRAGLGAQRPVRRTACISDGMHHGRTSSRGMAFMHRQGGTRRAPPTTSGWACGRRKFRLAPRSTSTRRRRSVPRRRRTSSSIRTRRTRI